MKDKYSRLPLIPGLGILSPSTVADHGEWNTDGKQMEVIYPETKRDNIVDHYHGQAVPDPYRWLEDDYAPDTKAWVEAQNVVTEEYLCKIRCRDTLRKRLTKLWDFERFGCPIKGGDFHYFFKNDGLQNQSVLFRQADQGEDAELVLDPNGFSEDGTIALGGISLNKEGTLLAYLVSEAGSDWHSIRVKDLISGKTLPDRIEWVKFSGVSWAGKGFYYSRFPKPSESHELSGQNKFHRLFYHKLGTGQEEDLLILEDRKNALRNFYAGTTEDERFLYVSISESTSGNALWVKDLHGQKKSWTIVRDDFEADLQVIDNIDNHLYILTNDDAPNWRLVAVDIFRPTHEHWSEILPETKYLLRNVHFAGGKLLAEYLVDARSELYCFNLSGKDKQSVKLPGLGSMGALEGRKGDPYAFYSFSSFTLPTTVFRLDLEKLNSEKFKEPGLDIDLAEVVTRQVFYHSSDGTRIPMFITHRKEIALDGSNPTLLYGYGGFDISLTPAFSVTHAVLLENKGVYAVANLRGGGEYGKEWHLAGTKERKQNVFDDFQAAAEYLIKEGYTSSSRLAIMGGSNGGLLVGACMTQRPDLFKVAIPQVGVLDMLRYHKFTIGWAWSEDYGRSDDPDAFRYLYAYSPLHNVRKADYPATLIMTADHDDRVVPAHSFKFAAELQRHHQGNAPILIRIDTSAGHGAGKPTSKVIEESTDLLSFLFYHMGQEIRYPNLES